MRNLIVVFILVANIAFAETNITLTGKIDIPGVEGNVVLTQVGEAEVEIQDVELIDNKFEISFSESKSELYILKYGLDDAIILALHPGDKIHINILPDNISVAGSQELENYFGLKGKLDLMIEKYELIHLESSETEDEKELAEIDNRLTKIADQYNSEIVSYLNTNKNSLLTLIYLEDLDIDEDFETYSNVTKSLFEKYPENIFVQAIKSKIDAAEKTAIGAMAPEIELPDSNGKIIKLSDLRGKVVLIDFWASWCGPCRRENPNMVKIYGLYNDKGFEIFGVSLDEKEENWLSAIDKDELHWTQVSDLKGWDTVAKDAYGFSGIPYTVLVDKDGKILAKGLRGEELEQKLEELFKD